MRDEDISMNIEEWINEQSSELDKKAVAIVGIVGWKPYYWDVVLNGVVVKGCMTKTITRGRNKGKLKWDTSKTLCTVVIENKDKV